MVITKAQIGIAIGGVTVASLVLGGGGYFLWQENNKSAEMLSLAQEKQAEASQKAQDNESSVDTSNWEIYRNKQYGFQLTYPDNWKSSVAESYGGARAFHFTNDKSRITILPKGEFDSGNIPEGEIVNGKLDGKNIKIRGDEYYFFYHVIDVVPNWIVCSGELKNCNRIEVFIDNNDRQVIDQILSTFRFID